VLLGLGLTQVDVVVVLFLIGWLFALAQREQKPLEERWAFNATQVVLVLATMIALGCLAFAVHQGLVVQPDMQVRGMGSGNGFLRWYQDRTQGALPHVRVVSIPLWIYKGLMLAWALWLATALLRWLRWGFGAFRTGGAWKRASRDRKTALEDSTADKAAPDASAAQASEPQPDAGDS
jgi:hypothetical protein